MSSENIPNHPAQKGSGKEGVKDYSNQTALAMELPFVMVSALAVGALLGFLLDRWLHTKPVFLLIFGAAGFIVGVRDVLRRLPGDGDARDGK